MKNEEKRIEEFLKEYEQSGEPDFDGVDIKTLKSKIKRFVFGYEEKPKSVSVLI
jgi:hypothetical protein